MVYKRVLKREGGVIRVYVRVRVCVRRKGG